MTHEKLSGHHASIRHLSQSVDNPGKTAHLSLYLCPAQYLQESRIHPPPYKQMSSLRDHWMDVPYYMT